MQIRNVPAVLVVVCLGLSLSQARTPQASTPRQLRRIAGWRGASPKSGDGFTFVVLSDRTGDHKKGAWAAAIEKVNPLQPDFVMSVGDFIEGYTKDRPTILRQWEEFDALTKKLQAPFFYCAGNHDVSNDLMLDIYRRRHGVAGKSYYSFNFRGCHFVVLDSETIVRKPESADEQFEWLEKDLAAAKSAEHVFIFGHHPFWYKHPIYADPKLWNRLRALLPAGKTTVFNGHAHQLGSQVSDGVRAYMLGATACRHSRPERIKGCFNMFAQVTVRQGKVNVAFLPVKEMFVNEVFAGGFSEYVMNVRSLSAQNLPCRAIPPKGGHYTYRQANPLTVPITAIAEWKAPGWEVSPRSGKLVIKAGETLEKKFLLTPQVAAPGNPKFSVSYKFTDPHSQRPVRLRESLIVGTYAEMKIPRIEGAIVDGKLDEYSGATPLVMDRPSRVYGWSGPKDCSFKLRAGTNGERLFVGLDVTDDDVYTQGKPWQIDTVEFYWDSRTPEQREERNLGEAAGRLVLVPPPAGAKPKPIWSPPTSRNPKGLVLAHRRRAGGYLYELSIPLRELGIKMPPKIAQEFRMELHLSDGDLIDGKPIVSRMTTSGTTVNFLYPSTYIRCTFE